VQPERPEAAFGRDVDRIRITHRTRHENVGALVRRDAAEESTILSVEDLQNPADIAMTVPHEQSIHIKLSIRRSGSLHRSAPVAASSETRPMFPSEMMIAPSHAAMPLLA
jgi:hypothetical protein